MNKKIKIIELLNKIANGEEIPEKIKFRNRIYTYKVISEGTGYVTEGYDWFNSDIYVDSMDDLNSYVEILEDNTEEIEELGEYSDLILMSENERVLFNMIKVTTHKVDEIIRKLNKLNTNKD